jgi:hypothetical protein
MCRLNEIAFCIIHKPQEIEKERERESELRDKKKGGRHDDCTIKEEKEMKRIRGKMKICSVLHAKNILH